MDGGAYTQGAGEGGTEYNPDVILNDASLNYTSGAGGAWIVAQGTTTLSGDPAGDLTIHATIDLTQTGACSGGTP